MRQPPEFAETNLGYVEFYPELKQYLLFTNMEEMAVPMARDPEKGGPFLSLDRPLHMMLYSETAKDHLVKGLLHYVKYSDEVVKGGKIEKQPAIFREFTRQACKWLSQNYVSSRGKNTADNPEQYLRVKDAGKLRH